jgi:hypothetical protein
MNMMTMTMMQTKMETDEHCRSHMDRLASVDWLHPIRPS